MLWYDWERKIYLEEEEARRIEAEARQCLDSCGRFPDPKTFSGNKYSIRNIALKTGPLLVLYDEQASKVLDDFACSPYETIGRDWDNIFRRYIELDCKCWKDYWLFKTRNEREYICP